MLEKIIGFLKNKIVLLVLVVVIGIFSSYILGHDNAIEELSELFIKNSVQVEIDLSPDSPEGK